MSSTSTAGAAPYDLEKIRNDFPILSKSVHGRPLVYFDNASTTHKPRAVLEALMGFYQGDYSNIHRSAHALAAAATRRYKAARERVARFANAADPAEIVFVRGTTEAINLVAGGYGRALLKSGDEIVTTALEHHSNMIPWQQACAQAGAALKVAPLTATGEIDLPALRKLLTPRTRLVAVTHLSNALGVITPVAEIVAMAHQAGARVLVDGAQWVARHPLDVRALDVDYYAFSGHKLYATTGIGVLYGKRALLEELPPYQGGGGMVDRVTIEKTTFMEPPAKFEAGTPNLGGAIALAAAIDYVESVGLEAVAAHEERLLLRAEEGLRRIPGVRVLAGGVKKSGALSFVVSDPPLATLDVGMALDLRGVAVRTGDHCCQPLMKELGVSGTVRVSFGLYNTAAEVDALVAAVAEIVADGRQKASRTANAPQAADVRYPAATAPDVTAAAGKIIKLFAFLPDWEARYEQLLDFGNKLLAMPAGLKRAGNLVHGCQSIVYLDIRVTGAGEDAAVSFLVDSDAAIVRGLAAVLQRIYAGQRAADILAFDSNAFITRLGLDEHLSLTRRNGLAAMVERIRRAAQASVDSKA